MSPRGGSAERARAPALSGPAAPPQVSFALSGGLAGAVGRRGGAPTAPVAWDRSLRTHQSPRLRRRHRTPAPRPMVLPQRADADSSTLAGVRRAQQRACRDGHADRGAPAAGEGPRRARAPLAGPQLRLVTESSLEHVRERRPLMPRVLENGESRRGVAVYDLPFPVVPYFAFGDDTYRHGPGRTTRTDPHSRTLKPPSLAGPYLHTAVYVWSHTARARPP